MPFAATAGKKAGIEIWRIEKMEPAPVDKAQYGSFYSGDSYIVLHTYAKGSGLQWDLFFWLGKDSSQDERGACALHTVALDDQLGGGPVQYREVQGHESANFQKLFPNIVYLDGGVASAFNHVDPDSYKPRLFQVKGKRNARVSQVALKSSSLNEGDVFILDLGRTLYLWNGKSANKYEKVQALNTLRHIINEERGGKATFEVIDSGVKNEHAAAFFKVLGPESAIKSAEEGGSDEAAEKGDAVLFEATGHGITELGRGRLDRGLLRNDACHILDTGATVYVWVGKQSPADLRKKAAQLGQKYLEDAKRPDHCSVVRIPGGGETPEFKAKFAQWDPPRVVTKDGPVVDLNRAVDHSGMLQRVRDEEEKAIKIDAGSEEVTVWRIENFAKVPVEKNLYGQFYMGDSYIVLHAYKQAGKQKWFIYFWQGQESSADERGSSALLAKQMDDDLGGDPVQVRVVQGKEPKSFIKLFKGRFVVHQGGKASGFKNRKAEDSYDTDGISLFHIKGNDASDTRAVQVAERASSLNSCDCFVLLTPGTMFVWNGSGANADERKTALSTADALKFGRSVQTIEEGSEPADFWDALGGKDDYPNSKTVDGGVIEPRLFHVSNKRRGFVDVEEIPNFNQDDLLNDDVMILDAGECLYVWVGHESQKQERDGAFQVALDYLRAKEGKPEGQEPDTPVFQIPAGGEPPGFTALFLGWNDAKSRDFGDKYAAQLAAFKKDGPKQVTRESIGFVKGVTFSYDQLKNNEAPGIDMSNKQNYLSDADFEKVFKMKRAEFEAMPAWKKSNKKKEVGLF